MSAKVARIREGIENGTYHVDPGVIAESILRRADEGKYISSGSHLSPEQCRKMYLAWLEGDSISMLVERYHCGPALVEAVIAGANAGANLGTNASGGLSQ